MKVMKHTIPFEKLSNVSTANINQRFLYTRYICPLVFVEGSNGVLSITCIVLCSCTILRYSFSNKNKTMK